MRKLKVFTICFLVVLIAISGCAKKPENLNICGDYECTLTEDCNNCPQDCGCKSNEYCDKTGLCRGVVCGDEICSDKEKIGETCCEDCGCPEGKVCNKINHKCKEKIEVSEELINDIVNKYLTDNRIEGNIVKTTDTYYKDNIVKQITIDCKTEEKPYPCLRILLIDEEGEIVEEMRTA